MQTDIGLLREAVPVGLRWVEAGPDAIKVLNPATGELVGHVPTIDAAGVRDAIETAEAAQKDWAAQTARARAVILRRWYDLIVEHADELAEILTQEQGKPLAEARGEILYGASFVEWFAEEARRIYGDVIPSHATDKRIMVLKQPVGVVAAITPWNFPNAMITRKVGPALAAGCAAVLKPASQTPFSAIALATLAERAGLPQGLFSVVTGSARVIGAELTSNPTVRKLTFTGSTEIGIELMKQCAPTVKKLSMELGGNAPFIVFDDADLEAAVDGAIVSKFRNNGQTCVCANRIYVQSGIYDAFAEKLSDRLSEMTVGNGMETGTDFGPLIDESAVAKIEEYIGDALSKGATLRLGGERHALGGTFFAPTVLTEVTADMMVTREETFGPLAPLIRFETTEEAIRLANDTEFGLASYIYTRDLALSWKMSEALEYGIVGLNTGLISTAEAPFGGIKSSGFGREGSHFGIEDYVEVKYVCVGGLT
jgi:succinate-semialdehyde dehydrogenase/glutarate-semialdehyde dehydrogenase